MVTFSKIHEQKDSDAIELTQKQVDHIAYKLLVDKLCVDDIANDLQIPHKIIESIMKASSHKEKWLNAIAKWGRLNLIQD